MKSCPNCGLVCGEKQSFCEGCGTPLFATRAASGSNENFSRSARDYAPYGWAEDSPYKPLHTEETRRAQPNFSFGQTAYQPPSGVVTPQTFPHSTQASPGFYSPYQSAFSTDYMCPRCHTNTLPQLKKRTSLAGWIIFGVLLFMFAPLCWIGLLIKEFRPVCPNCGYDPQ